MATQNPRKHTNPRESARPRDGINQRRARAGQLLLQNPAKSTKKALIEAGFAESTAARPKANGLTADRCVAEAIKADPKIDPAKLLESTRAALAKRLNDPETVDKARLGELARLVEVTERWYGGHSGEGTTDAVTFVDRMELLAKVMNELQRRGKITVNE